ncbi:MAG TPA: ABC transporter permease [Candidatus Dormibacteraeota bacterium]|nr:ABC transporter permease [Candidatus Dormibacteraeota bacterium]
MARSDDAPLTTTEATADLTAAAGVAEVPPEVVAQSLGEYLRGWLARVKNGDSGVLPVVLAIVVVAVTFEIVTPENAFLRPSNLIYIFQESTVYMVLAMAEIVVLLVGEIDLSIGSVSLLGGVIAFKLVQAPRPNLPWWGAIIAALLICAAIGAIQGSLVARLKIPSFIVTLAGFLLFSGILVLVLGGADGSVSVSASVPNQSVIYNLVQGFIDPIAGWIALAVVVAAGGTALWLRGSARRRSGLVAPPASLIAIRIALMAAVGIGVVALSDVNRANIGTIEGVPWVIPIVLAVLGAWTLLLQRTRFGRYVYAIGGNPEAAQRAGVSLPAVRTWAFVLSSVTAGIAGILLGSFFYGQFSTNTADPGQLVLYAVAAAVIGGTSLFGGRGRAIHGVLGGLVIGGIAYGMALLGLAAQWEYVVTGGVLLGAVLVDVLSRRAAGSGNLARA